MPKYFFKIIYRKNKLLKTDHITIFYNLAIFSNKKPCKKMIACLQISFTRFVFVYYVFRIENCSCKFKYP